MYSGPGVKTDPNYPIPDTQRAWVLGNPGELKLINKPIPVPTAAVIPQYYDTAPPGYPPGRRMKR